MRIRVFEAFAGYGSQMMALRRLSKHSPNLQFELVGWSEIDYYAIQAHNAVWEDDRDKNYGDICKIDWSKVPDFDLFTYSFPCQSVSDIAGTIKARVNTNCMYFVSEDLSDENGQSDGRGERPTSDT